jgi:hypothetical protein
VHRALLIAAITALVSATRAAELEHSREVARWHEVRVPPASDSGAHAVWSSAANHSRYTWRVFAADRGDIRAQFAEVKLEDERPRPRRALLVQR